MQRGRGWVGPWPVVGGSYSVLSWVPVTRVSESSGGPVWISGLMAHGGVQCQDWGLPFLGWSEGPFRGVGSQGTEDRASLTHSASPARPCSVPVGPWWRVETLALVGAWTCPALKCPVLRA